jgi:hypothetical protein
MIWLNPIAFAGLLAVAIPVFVHLFVRRRARHQRFPSLRLLQMTAATAATSTRPSDFLLLAIRSAIVVAAVAALAQPLFRTGARANEASRVARVILVDTSASMHGLTSEGALAVDLARTIARDLTDSSRAALVVETGMPGADAAAAASWVTAQGGSTELVVISDFQATALSAGHLAPVPPSVGIRFRRIDVASAPTVEVEESRRSIRLDDSTTRAVWNARAPGDPAVSVVAADADREVLSATLAAVSSGNGGSRRATITFPGASQATAVEPVDSTWFGDALLALGSDHVLKELHVTPANASPCDSSGIPVGGTAQSPIARLSADRRVHACVAPGSLEAALLVARVAAALPTRTSPPDLEPRFLPDELLRTWERPPGGSAAPVRTTSPDGRWLWLIAIVLVGVEQWVRRVPAKSPRSRQAEERHVRVA